MKIYDGDFHEQFVQGKRLSSVIVTYRMPDFLSILNEFIWQTLDIPPKYPRIYKFIDFWETNIEAPIYKIEIINCGLIPSDMRTVKHYLRIR